MRWFGLGLMVVLLASSGCVMVYHASPALTPEEEATLRSAHFEDKVVGAQSSGNVIGFLADGKRDLSPPPLYPCQDGLQADGVPPQRFSGYNACEDHTQEFIDGLQAGGVFKRVDYKGCLDSLDYVVSVKSTKCPPYLCQGMVGLFQILTLGIIPNGGPNERSLVFDIRRPRDGRRAHVDFVSREMFLSGSWVCLFALSEEWTLRKPDERRYGLRLAYSIAKAMSQCPASGAAPATANSIFSKAVPRDPFK